MSNPLTVRRPKQQEGQELKDMVTNIMTKVFGASGTQIYNGYIDGDYKAEWSNLSSRVDLIDEMRKSDATVAAGLRVLKAPILAANWYIEGDNPEHKDVIEQSLFNLECRSWKDFLREACGFLDFGFYPFEQIWKVEKGVILLKDLAPRIPKSVEKFKMQDGQPGITQNINGDLAIEGNASTVSIPLGKLLIFTNDKEGDDVSGQSILRPAYKHFFIKDLLYKISGISCERYGVGIPSITIPDGAGPTEKLAAQELGRNLRSNEEAYIVQYGNIKVEILTPNGNPQEGQITNLIQHHNREILLSMLAHSLDLGSGKTGSFALSTDQKGDLMQFCEEKASYLEHQINEQVIKKLIIANFGKQDNYPKLKHQPLGTIDFGAVSAAWKTLIDTGLAPITPSWQDTARQMFNIPEMTEEEKEKMEMDAMDADLDAMEADMTEAAGTEDDFNFDDSDLPEVEDDEEEPEEEVAAETEEETIV